MQEAQPNGLILGVALSPGLTCVSHWQYFNHLGYPKEDTDSDEDREDLMRTKVCGMANVALHKKWVAERLVARDFQTGPVQPPS